jgi:hypothetical protein
MSSSFACRIRTDGEITEGDMKAVKAHFDGKTIKIPRELREAPPGEALVIIQERPEEADNTLSWLKARETAVAKVRDNEDDAVYDSL